VLQEEVPAVREFLAGTGAPKAEVRLPTPASTEAGTPAELGSLVAPKPLPKEKEKTAAPTPPELQPAVAVPGVSLPAEAQVAEALVQGQVSGGTPSEVKAAKPVEAPAPLSKEERLRLQRDIKVLVDQGKKELRRGRYLLALSKFDDAQKLGGDSPELRALTAQCIKKLEAQSKLK
jgi:hypothetical protein